MYVLCFSYIHDAKRSMNVLKIFVCQQVSFLSRGLKRDKTLCGPRCCSITTGRETGIPHGEVNVETSVNYFWIPAKRCTFG